MFLINQEKRGVRIARKNWDGKGTFKQVIAAMERLK